MINDRAPIWSDLFGHLEASGGRLEFNPRRVMPFLQKIAPRHSESTIFGVRGVQERAQHGSQNSFQWQPGSKSILGVSRARFSSVLGLILGLPNRSKNGTNNALILGPGARGAQWLTESGLPARLELHLVRSAIKEGVQRGSAEGRSRYLWFWGSGGDSFGTF